MTELKSCRLEKKLTQAEAAERLGVSLRSYITYENDETKKEQPAAKCPTGFSSYDYTYTIATEIFDFAIDLRAEQTLTIPFGTPPRTDCSLFINTVFL